MDYTTQVAVMRTMMRDRGMVPTSIDDVPRMLRQLADDSQGMSSVLRKVDARTNRLGMPTAARGRAEAMEANEVLLLAMAANIEQDLTDTMDAHAAAESAVQVEGSYDRPGPPRWVDVDGDAHYHEPADCDPEYQLAELIERRRDDRRKYDRRGLPAGADGDRLYGRRASDPR